MQTRAVIASLALSAAVMVVVSVAAPFIVPVVFGSRYEPAVDLVWILAPGGVFLPSNQVMGDMLRGRGQPLAVAFSQGVGAIATISLLALLVPTQGARGAAISSTVAYAITFAALFYKLRETSRTPQALPIS